LLKYGPKLVHLAEVSPYFRGAASVLHAGEFFGGIKRFECENFLFKCDADGLTIVNRLPLSCIMYTSNISENISPTKEE
jgi:hypothetical protein